MAVLFSSPRRKTGLILNRFVVIPLDLKSRSGYVTIWLLFLVDQRVLVTYCAVMSLLMVRKF